MHPRARSGPTATALTLLLLAVGGTVTALGSEPPAARADGPGGAVPGYARFVTVQGGGAGTVSQILVASDDIPFTVTGVESPLPHLAVAWREARPEERLPGAAGSQWVVETTLASEAPVGPLGALVTVHLDRPEQPTLPIPVTGFVRPRFAVTPPSASLGAVAAGDGPFRLFVRNFTAAPSELGTPTCTVAGVTATVQPAEPGHGWWVVVKIGADVPSGAFAGEVRVPTTTAGQPQLVIEVSGTGPTPPRDRDEAPPGGTP